MGFATFPWWGPPIFKEMARNILLDVGFSEAEVSLQGALGAFELSGRTEFVEGALNARLPAIEALWSEGKIGENNQGYVEARAELSAKEQTLLHAENADRKAVYQAIARSTQLTPKQVGV